MAATYNEAIWWIAANDDEAAGNAEFPLVTESLVAHLFDTTTDHVCFCVARARGYIARGEPVPVMRSKPRNFIGMVVP